MHRSMSAAGISVNLRQRTTETKFGSKMKKQIFIGWNDKPMNEITIKGEKICVPVWGGQEEATKTTWNELKKLGFELRDRAFGHLNDGTPALFFMAHENNPYRRIWYVTTETLEELKLK